MGRVITEKQEQYALAWRDLRNRLLVLRVIVIGSMLLLFCYMVIAMELHIIRAGTNVLLIWGPLGAFVLANVLAARYWFRLRCPRCRNLFNWPDTMLPHADCVHCHLTREEMRRLAFSAE